MMREIGLISILLILGEAFLNPLFSQEEGENAWDILADVSFAPKFLEEYGERFLVPEFGQRPREREGKPLMITGYIIPADPENDVYILSQNPFSSCFFCGSAGPETILELVFKKKSKTRKKLYELDDIRTFQGILRLNAGDIEHTNYILEDVKEIL